MKAIWQTFYIALAALLTSCGPMVVKKDVMPSSSLFVGCYTDDDSDWLEAHFLQLQLKSDMTYRAVFQGHMLLAVSTAGKWQMIDNSIVFHSDTNEESWMKLDGPHKIYHSFLQDYSFAGNEPWGQIKHIDCKEKKVTY